MSEVRTLKCDGENCRKLRLDDSNHWWQAYATEEVVTVARLEYNQPTGANARHFCGEQCLMKWFMVQLDKLRGV